jgi:AhpD family alkylhydroperoxidase
MEPSYYGKGQIKNLGKMKALKAELYQSFAEFDRLSFADGELPGKTKELIAVACAHVTRCPYCIDAHTRRAVRAGATEGEIAEAIFVAAAMSAGASMAHACIAMESLGEQG